LEALKETIASDRATGRKPFCIVANAGTTNTGTIAPLSALAKLAHQEDLWFHIDAAYGGFFHLTERGHERLTKIEQADPVVLEPHKGLFLPFGTGFLNRSPAAPCSSFCLNGRTRLKQSKYAIEWRAPFPGHRFLKEGWLWPRRRLVLKKMSHLDEQFENGGVLSRQLTQAFLEFQALF
jgi:Pyridoxal-dependent decarboxylase conserved domain